MNELYEQLKREAEEIIKANGFNSIQEAVDYIDRIDSERKMQDNEVKDESIANLSG